MSASVSDLTAEERGVQDEQETKQAERVDRPPADPEDIPPAKIYQPLSFPVIAFLMPGAVFGTLARLGLVALMTYDGNSVFPLAYAQAVGCLVIGITMRFKEPLGQLSVPLLFASHAD
jgi:CrcB protein